jgi:hypothetical protein
MRARSVGFFRVNECYSDVTPTDRQLNRFALKLAQPESSVARYGVISNTVPVL